MTGDEPQDPTRGVSNDTTRTTPGASGGHERIGAYRIFEQVGAGGMGEVYRAEQTEPIRRTVALKIIKRGMDTKEVITRFEAERQALALMDHPNIAKVLDAGSTPRGRPYFVMEYVRGEPITHFCDKQRLTTRERLRLFMQLCEGVQHAHQKAIIHRDLKPSNVLVTIQDEKPVPKIIDFGVAKATAQKLTEKTMYTALGELIGTPDYMSPEQAEMTGAEVDTRTDVYSLGVVFYELLAGALPFDPTELRKRGFEGIIRMIREQDPPRPSTRVGTLGERRDEVAAARQTLPDRLGRGLRGDLDWITMRALEKNPTRRYGSAAELAADVRRHLRNEPVLASPPSAAYRTRKFVRRNRLAVGIAAALTLLLAGFAVTMARERDRANLQAERANAEAQAAREVTEFLVSSFELVDPMDARGDSITAREVLDLGAQRIEHELGDQPRLRAQMMDAIGRVYRDLDRLERAEELLEGALALRRVELGERHVDTARSMSTLARLRFFQQRTDEGRQLARKALSIQEELLGDHVDTAWTLYYLAWLESSSRTNNRELLERALVMFESPPSSDARGASWCWQDLGLIYFDMGDFAKALECFKRAFEIKERILPANHADIAVSSGSVGRALGFLGDWAAAVPYLEKRLESVENTLGPDNWRTAYALHDLGQARRETGQFVEAKALHERALAICRDIWGEESFEVASLLDELGLLAHASGRHAEAESLYARAVPMMEKIFAPGEGNVYFVGLLEHYAALLRELNRDPEADSLLQRAKALRKTFEQLEGMD